MQIPIIETKSFYYDLPQHKIAQYPLPERNKSKLLIYKDGQISEDIFQNITQYIPSEYLLVFNNTKVLPARLNFQKETGANIEIFLLEPYSPFDYSQIFNQTQTCQWLCFVGNAKKWKENTNLIKTLKVNSEDIVITCRNLSSHNNAYIIQFDWNKNIKFIDILTYIGKIPIPPYLKRETEEIDFERYQTVFSKYLGSVAAPTASLHFTNNEFDNLQKNNISYSYLTLHVGAGTFKPMNSRYIHEHELHSELFSISIETLNSIIAHYPKIIAVGTTALRALESIYHFANKLALNQNKVNFFVSQWCEYDNIKKTSPLDALTNLVNYMLCNQLNKLNIRTQIMISPGYSIKMAESIITNFHQPQSSLLALVAAFVGNDWRNIYEYALNNNFRFLSYGDSSLLWKK
ncbi:MAG: S-adenosylmethionine:tRNA ribosyltransferase-isomerase [Bacteroidales bacterium]|nr:S-adenosylmethionine:tRNA ribosyltransferase-isomerase [Bacteroidales bacterium]